MTDASGDYKPGGIVPNSAVNYMKWPDDVVANNAIYRVPVMEAERDPVNPSHYKDGWSDDAELISISENLTSNGGQALQYVARSTRLDRALIKGNPIEDLEKAIWFCQREIKRLNAEGVSLNLTPKGAGTLTLNGVPVGPIRSDA